MLDLTEHIHTSKHSDVRNSVLSARNLMMTVALSLVGSLLVVPSSIFTLVFATTPYALIILCALMGTWYTAYLLPDLFVPHLGAFLVAGLLMDTVATFTTPLGPLAIIGNLVGAAFLKTPTLLFLYRKWSWWIHVIGVIIFDGFSSTMYSNACHIAQDSLQFSLGIILSLTPCYLTLTPALLLKRRLARAGVRVKQ